VGSFTQAGSNLRSSKSAGSTGETGILSSTGNASGSKSKAAAHPILKLIDKLSNSFTCHPVPGLL
jgi:hypothetical protein